MLLVKRGHAPGPFWVKNLEKITILSLSGYLLEFTLDVHQTWYVYSSKYKDVARKKGSRPGLFCVKYLEKKYDFEPVRLSPPRILVGSPSNLVCVFK